MCACMCCECKCAEQCGHVIFSPNVIFSSPVIIIRSSVFSSNLSQLLFPSSIMHGRRCCFGTSLTNAFACFSFNFSANKRSRGFIALNFSTPILSFNFFLTLEGVSFNSREQFPSLACLTMMCNLSMKLFCFHASVPSFSIHSCLMRALRCCFDSFFFLVSIVFVTSIGS